MDAALYRRAREVFFGALDVPPSSRDAYVRAECADDPVLRREVDALLDALAADDGFAASEGPGARLRDSIDASWAARERETSPDMPRRIGRHDVKGCLGEGGMGVVYEAEQRQPRRRVAIKVLRPELVTPESIVRFRREAELLGRLRHPGIASVFEAGQARPWGGPELPYLVMELVDGLPLTAHAAAHRLSAAQRLELVARVCDAIQHAHERGVVHGDLKPANVLVDETGQPRVLDFGVARALDGEPAKAGAGGEALLAGTLAYMSPEQLSGASPQGGVASDVHGLGVLAYELLAGRLPLPLAGLPLAEAMRRVMHDDPPRLGALDRSLAGDVEAIVGKALEKDPQRRYSSAAQLAADIRRHLHHEPILARRPGPALRARKFVRRHRALAASLSALVAVLAAGAVVSAVLAVDATRARRAAEAATTEAQRSGYRALLGAAVAALRDGDAQAARAHLDAAPEARRDWGWRHLDASVDDSLAVVRTEVRGQPRITPVPGGLVVHGSDGISVVRRDGGGLRLAARRAGRFVAASADGSAALELRDGRWLVHDTRDLTARPVALAAASGASAVALPRGGWIVQADGQLVAVGTRGEDPWPTGIADEGSGDRTLAVSPDGALLVAASDEAWALVTLEGRARRDLTARQSRVITFAPDGRLIAADAHGRLACMDVESGAACGWRALDTGGRRIRWLRADATGRRLLTVDRTGQVRLWRLDDGEHLGVVSTVGHDSSRAFFSPDGETVLVPRVNGSLQAFSASDGRPIGLPRLGHEAPVTDAAWIDGRLLSVDQRGELREFMPAGGVERTRLAGHEAYVYATDVSPDGRLVASTSWDGTIRLWDARTGAPVRAVRAGAETARALRFLPDGTRLASVQDSRLVLTDVATGDELFVGAAGAADLDVDASGRIALALVGGGVELADSDGRRLGGLPARRTAGPLDTIHLAFAPSGSRAVVSEGPHVRVIDVAAGSELFTTASMVGDVLSVAWRPDGSAFAAGTREGAIVVWAAATGSLLRQAHLSGGAVLGLAFHEGAPIAAGLHDGSVVLLDDDLERTVRLTAHDDYVRDVAYSPDGTMLVSASGDATLRIFDTLGARERLGR